MNYHTLNARQAGIDTLDTAVAYMRRDCPVCRSEGFNALKRIRLSVSGGPEVTAELNVVDEAADWIRPREVALSNAAWNRLGVRTGDAVRVSPTDPVESLGHVRARLYGESTSHDAFLEILSDVIGDRYRDIEIATFLAACTARPMSVDEIVALTHAMVEVGEHLVWSGNRIYDKHCIGGLPGNRTTPIVVAIAAAAGLRIPKTSSRAITSPAGTADVVQTLMPVNLDLPTMHKVVEHEGGCLVWGGAVNLSPADDRLIRVERVMDVDSTGQLVASVLSKKVAAGSTHVLIDIPVGPTAKCRSLEAANELESVLKSVGEALDLSVLCHRSDGYEPVGRGLGPANEARDVISVLTGQSAPADLRTRSLQLAGMLLEMSGSVPPTLGVQIAGDLLDSGQAWEKFCAIAAAQGGLREPPSPEYERTIVARHGGRVTAVDNRLLARLAKLAGAPAAPAAGLLLHVQLGNTVSSGDPLMTITAQTEGERDYAAHYADVHTDIWRIEA